MHHTRSTQIKLFIGIDISKNKLDICAINETTKLLKKVIGNTPAEIEAFMDNLMKIKDYDLAGTLFCMEETGIYSNHLLRVLEKFKANIAIENALHIKQSMGLVRDKDDEKDAYRIALYALRHLDQIQLWQAPRAVIIRLRYLSAFRERMVLVSTMMKTPVKEGFGFLADEFKQEYKTQSRDSIAALKADIKKVEEIIESLIKDDHHLNNLNLLMMSVPGIGKHTALQFLIKTNEFKSYQLPEKFACFAGVVPFKSVSGLQTGRARISHLANKQMKKLLHICAVRVIRVDPELKAYYLRRTETDKKAKMSVINAIRNKLIKRGFACVRENRPYLPKTGTDA